MQPSKYQLDIFTNILAGQRHIQVQAYAGSGKSTTQREAIKQLPDTDDIAVFAFNKLIATDMQAKLISPNVTIKTLNGFGWGALLKACGRIELDKFKTSNILESRIFDLSDKRDKAEFYKTRNIITKIVGLFKHLKVMDLQEAFAMVPELIDNYNIELRGADANRVQEHAVEAFRIGREQTKFFDFDDQVYMPLYLEIAVPQFKWVFIDELQDLSPVQMELVYRAGVNGKIVGVGDKHQAIYGFRGASVKAMEDFATHLNALQLPLSICYRCPKAVIREAQKIVPGIEAFDGAPEGIVEWIKEDKYEPMMQPGDWTLCRTTAPLVTWCLRLIRKGRKATIKGKDIGENLINLIEDVAVYKGDTFVNRLNNYHADETEKLSRRDNNDDLIDALNERVQTIQALIDGLEAGKNPDKFTLTNQVRAIFTDDVVGIAFCTAHKSKGLEANRIFIISPELMPHPRAKREWQIEQEHNLLYVARTRAMQELYYVETSK